MNDAGAERNVLSLQPVGIPRPVEALVVVTDGGHGVVEEAEPVDDARPLLCVPLHQRPLIAGEARGLQEDRVRDGELPDVVEERRMPEQVQLCVRETELPSDCQRELLDPARVAGGVGVSCVDRGRQGFHRCRGPLLEELVRQLEGDVLRLDRLGGLAELLRAALRVLEVRLLRLPHQQQRNREHRECEQLDGFVRERHHAADEAVHEVVRQQPREALPEDRPPALVSLQGERQRDEAHVDHEVSSAGEQAQAGSSELVRGAVREERRDLEHARRGE